MTLTERAAYLKGLCEGLKLDEQKPESRLINEIILLLDDMALTLADIEEDVGTLHDYIEEIDEDLGGVEDILYDEDDYDDEEEDEADCFEIVCPSCGETVCFDIDTDISGLACPACNKKFDYLYDGDSCEDCK